MNETFLHKEEVDELKANFLHLEVGSSDRSYCPRCGGGSSKEKSFSVTRKPEGLVYKCFRAKCQVSGFIGSRNNYATQGNFQDSTRSNTYKDRSYKGNLYLLSIESKKYICNRFHLTEDDLVGFRETDTKDIMIPMRDYTGRVYGHINRRWQGLVGHTRVPKSINYYTDKPDYNLHFNQQISNKVTTAVLVEDIISSIRVGKLAYAVSLNGTHLSEQEAALLSALGITKLVILLDADANGASRKMYDKYSLMFPGCVSIQRPEKDLDPKDMTPAELEELLNRKGII